MVKRYGEIFWHNGDEMECGIGQLSDGKYVTYADYAALQVKADAMEAALGWYADQFCEGFCQDLPSVGYTDENCERDCSGCKARAALAQHGSKA